MKILGIVFAYIITIVAIITGVECWEDHPDLEDHRETDRMLKEANCALGAEEYLTSQIQKEQDETLKNYKTSQFRKKNEESN